MGASGRRDAASAKPAKAEGGRTARPHGADAPKRWATAARLARYKGNRPRGRGIYRSGITPSYLGFHPDAHPYSPALTRRGFFVGQPAAALRKSKHRMLLISRTIVRD